MTRRSFIYFFLIPNLLLPGVITKNVSFSQGQFSFTKADGYDIISLPTRLRPGEKEYSSWEKGKPLLPVVSLSVLLPPTAEITNVKIVSYDVEEFSGEYVPYPVQSIRPIFSKENYPFVEPDEFVYKSTSAYPAEIIRFVPTGCLSGYRIAGINLFPIQFLPADKKLRLYTNLVLEIHYEEDRHPLVRLTKSQIKLFGREVKNMITNPDAVEKWAPLTKELRNSTEVDYVIITSPSLISNWDALKNWKIKKGFRTEVIGTDSIYAHYSGRDNQERIRNFVIDYWQNKGLKWVLLAGDDFIIPDRKTRLVIEESTAVGNIPTDMYYADLQWSWDGNGNNLFGEFSDTVDLLHDVYVGRAPIDNATNIATFIKKDTIYEKHPDTTYLKSLLLPSEYLWPPYHGKVINNLIADQFPVDWKISKLEDPPSTATRDSLNQGYQFCHISAHGNYYTLGVFDMSQIPSLSNGSKYNIMNAISCMCGQFDGVDCIAESLVNYPNGGCVAAILNSRYGLGYPPALGPSDMIDLEFYKCFIQNSIFEIGAAHAMSKDNLRNLAMSQPATRWCVYGLTLFGDPSLPMWSVIPQHMTVTHVSSIPSEPQVFRVSVEASGLPVDNALVCLIKETEVYAVGETNFLGWIDLYINPNTVGAMEVTVTARDCLPYEGTCSVTSGSPGACVIYQSSFIDDSGGNNNGILDPDETVDLSVTLKNGGNANATNVNGILRTTSGYISLIDSTSSYGTISAGDSATGDIFIVSVSDSAPQGTEVEFFVYTTANEGTWEPFFETVVGEPQEPRRIWADHDTGSCVLTVTSFGGFGTTFPYGEGSGFKYSKIASYGCLFYASMLAGTDPSYIVDRFYTPSFPNINEDFIIVDTLKPLIPPFAAEEEHQAIYNDSGHPTPKGLEVRQWSLSLSQPGHDDYVMLCFDYYNHGEEPINDFYSGLMFDFDIYGETNNIVRYDSIKRFIYMMRSPSEMFPTAGIKLLEPGNARNLSAVDHVLYVEPPSMMTEAVKDSFLSGKIRMPNSDRTDNWSICVSAGPFDLPVDEKVRVVYAIVAGDNESLAKINADSAQSWWDQNGVEEDYTYDAQIYSCVTIRPNPASKMTNIHYNVPKREKLVIHVFDVLGRVIDKVFEGEVQGKGCIPWQPSNLSTGIYFMRVERSNSTLIKKIIYLH